MSKINYNILKKHPNREQKALILREYLKERLNFFYQQMRLYLVQVKGQTRAKTLALRFLISAQRLDESSYEKEIRELKKNSVFLYPSIDLKTKKNSSNRNKAALLINKPAITNQKEEEKSISSEESIKEAPIEEFKSNIIKRASNFDGNVVRKPVFQYIPEDMELRKMIRRGIIAKNK